jgi:hypothetical protein
MARSIFTDSRARTASARCESASLNAKLEPLRVNAKGWTYDKRKGRRTSLTHRAEIARLENGERIADCVVLDISETGARLGVLATADIPEEFVLVVSKAGKVLRRCKVMRKTATELGVAFVRAAKK